MVNAMKWPQLAFAIFVLACALTVAVSSVVIASKSKSHVSLHKTLKVKRLHSGPCIFYIEGFAHHDECSAARGLLDPTRADYRSLTGSSRDVPLLNTFVRRFAGVANLPLDLITVSHIYIRSPGKKKKVHVDYLGRGSSELRKRGQRVWTMLIGLSRSRGSGGEFAFPAVGRKINLRFGDAIAWRNTTLDGIDDPDSAHEQLKLSKDAPERYYLVLYGRSLHHAP